MNWNTNKKMAYRYWTRILYAFSRFIVFQFFRCSQTSETNGAASSPICVCVYFCVFVRKKVSINRKIVSFCVRSISVEHWLFSTGVKRNTHAIKFKSIRFFSLCLWYSLKSANFLQPLVLLLRRRRTLTESKWEKKQSMVDISLRHGSCFPVVLRKKTNINPATKVHNNIIELISFDRRKHTQCGMNKKQQQQQQTSHSKKENNKIELVWYFFSSKEKSAVNRYSLIGVACAYVFHWICRAWNAILYPAWIAIRDRQWHCRGFISGVLHSSWTIIVKANKCSGDINLPVG